MNSLAERLLPKLLALQQQRDGSMQSSMHQTYASGQCISPVHPQHQSNALVQGTEAVHKRSASAQCISPAHQSNTKRNALAQRISPAHQPAAPV